MIKVLRYIYDRITSLLMTKTKVVSGVMMVMIYDKARDLIKRKSKETLCFSTTQL